MGHKIPETSHATMKTKKVRTEPTNILCKSVSVMDYLAKLISNSHVLVRTQLFKTDYLDTWKVSVKHSTLLPVYTFAYIGKQPLAGSPEIVAASQNVVAILLRRVWEHCEILVYGMALWKFTLSYANQKSFLIEVSFSLTSHFICSEGAY